MVPPPKLWVFSTATAAVDTRYGPAFGATTPAKTSASTSPLTEGTVRMVRPWTAACAPISARAMCAPTSQTTSWPGSTSSRTPSRFASEPVEQNNPASCPRSSAVRRSSAITVGSSPYTSSPTGAASIASRIAGVGTVTVSDRRSITTAAPRQNETGTNDWTGLARRIRPVVSRSATRKASSSDWFRFNRGSHRVS